MKIKSRVSRQNSGRSCSHPHVWTGLLFARGFGDEEVGSCSKLYLPAEDMEDGESLLVVDDQLPVLHLVTKRRQTPHPHALLLGSGILSRMRSPATSARTEQKNRTFLRDFRVEIAQRILLADRRDAFSDSAMVAFVARSRGSGWFQPKEARARPTGAGNPFGDLGKRRSDNDRADGHVLTSRVRAMGIRDRPISPGLPCGCAERLIGTLRRWLDCRGWGSTPDIRLSTLKNPLEAAAVS
jgi:hypothetical protein